MARQTRHFLKSSFSSFPNTIGITCYIQDRILFYVLEKLFKTRFQFWACSCFLCVVQSHLLLLIFCRFALLIVAYRNSPWSNCHKEGKKVFALDGESSTYWKVRHFLAVTASVEHNGVKLRSMNPESDVKSLCAISVWFIVDLALFLLVFQFAKTGF